MSARPAQRKRRRVALACDNCRERKVRCDGTKPVCGPCRHRRHGTQRCAYHVVSGSERATNERAYVQSLRNHINDLERQVQEALSQPGETVRQRHAGDGDETRSSPVSSRSNRGAFNSSGVHLGGGSSSSSSSSNGNQNGCATASTEEEADSPITAMGSAVPMSMVNDSPNTTDKFYGQSSIVSLVQDMAGPSCVVQTQASRRSGVLSGSSSRQAPLASTSMPRASATSSASLFHQNLLLPPRKVADALLAVYWEDVHLFYPWVHTKSFMQSYRAIWSPEGENADGDAQMGDSDPADVGLGGRDCPASMFYCALNAMFAMGCELSRLVPPGAKPSSSTFYDRIKSLLQVDLLDSGSLAHVQTLLLVAQYLQCTRLPTRCWNAVGMAYRMSVSLGLHSNASTDAMSALEREMRRRTWHACLQMDLVVSMTLGRPSTAARSYNVPLPLAIDDEYLSAATSDHCQPDGIVSRTQFSVENVKLTYILGQVLSGVYHQPENSFDSTSPHQAGPSMQAVLRLDDTLGDFEALVHPALKWAAPANAVYERNRIFLRQRNVLHARFLHIKLLLHRPSFTYYCSQLGKRHSRETVARQSTNMSSLSLRDSAMVCVQIACELIDSMAKAISRDETGAWWYGVFYLVSAGIILILAEPLDSLTTRLDVGDLEVYWTMCSHTLVRIAETVDVSAREYAAALDSLKERVSAQRKSQFPRQDQADSVAPPPPTYNGPEGDDRRFHREQATAPQLRQMTPASAENLQNLNYPMGPLEEAFNPVLSTWDLGLEDGLFPAFSVPGALYSAEGTESLLSNVF